MMTDAQRLEAFYEMLQLKPAGKSELHQADGRDSGLYQIILGIFLSHAHGREITITDGMVIRFGQLISSEPQVLTFTKCEGGITVSLK